MYIKQLINNKEEYWEFVRPFIEWANNPNKSLWREEDYPKLKPFFDVQNIVNVHQEWTDEVKESFDFYQKCSAEYADKNKELRDSVSKATVEDILEAFGYEIPDEEEDWTLAPKIDENFTFPFVVTGDINCGWDRSGTFQVLAIYHVFLKDFKEN